MQVSFVRTAGARDRIYVRRTSGSEVSWEFPSYGDELPHDLVHLVVEELGLPDVPILHVRARLVMLRGRWRALGAKGTLALGFSP